MMMANSRCRVRSMRIREKQAAISIVADRLSRIKALVDTERARRVEDHRVPEDWRTWPLQEAA